MKKLLSITSLCILFGCTPAPEEQLQSPNIELVVVKDSTTHQVKIQIQAVDSFSKMKKDSGKYGW